MAIIRPSTNQYHVYDEIYLIITSNDRWITIEVQVQTFLFVLKAE